MSGRHCYLALAALVAAIPSLAWSQINATPAPAAEPKAFVSAAEIMALVAKAEEARKSGTQANNGPLLQLAPYTANLEYRTSIGTAAIHEKEAELFVVIDGSGSVVIGGKLVNETRRNADNLSGTAIDGGVTRKLAKGDMFIVPENTAHWFSVVDGTLVLMSLHVPRPIPAR